MSWPDGFDLEPERYELDAAPLHRFELSRREFSKLLGSGIVVFFLGDALAVQESGGGRRRGFDEPMPRELAAWLHIDERGMITVYTGKVEVGQGIRTSLAQVVAEELRAPIESIRMVMGDTDLTLFDIGTFGSRTTPIMAPQLRKAAATARELLIDLAADKLQVERATLIVAGGRVIHPETKRALDFGQLTKGRKLIKQISDDVPTTPAKEWQVAGRSVPKLEGRALVTGKHKYASDLKLGGMLYGKVLRPLAFGATLVSLDTREAETVPGAIIARDGNFVGVAAPTPDAAARAVALIKAEWKSKPQPSSGEIFDYLRRHPAEGQSWGRAARHTAGSIERGFAASEKMLEQTYTVAYIAHAPLEPRAALAQWIDGKLTVWTGTQRPFGVRSELAEVFRIPEERVRVIVPDTGSGYGGKHTGDAAIEAARLARAAGKPVKVVWTREEEFTWAYFRPAGVIDVKSGVKGDGKIVAWEFHNYNSGAAAIRTPYDILNQKIEFHPAESPLRQGSYRALAATANHFARETHMDELAHLLNMDPLEFRYKNISDQRLRAVLEAAATRFGWGKEKPAPDRGFGLACGYEKGGYIATCAEISVERASGKVKILRVVAAFECGAIINPDNLRNQIEGSIVMGIGGALFEAIEFENGKILNPRFSRYRVPRFSDVPIIETILIDRKDLPSAGAGETPIVGIAPAVGNAIFDATGMRQRSLPLVPNGLKNLMQTQIEPWRSL